MPHLSAHPHLQQHNRVLVVALISGFQNAEERETTLPLIPALSLDHLSLYVTCEVGKERINCADT